MRKSVDQNSGLSESSPEQTEPGSGPILDLIPDRSAAPGETRGVGGSVSAEVRGSMTKAGDSSGFSIPEFLVASFHLLLARYSRRAQIRSMVIASSGGERGATWTARSVLTRSEAETTFGHLLSQVSEGLRTAGKTERASGEQGAVVVILSGEGNLAEVGVAAAEEAGCGRFEVLLAVRPAAREIELCLVHHPDQVGTDAAQRMMKHLETLLAGATQAVDSKVSEVPLMDEEERVLVQESWNDTAVSYPRDASIGELFAKQAEKSPEAPAVEASGEILSYSQLHRLSNQVGHLLLREGVRPGHLVGIAMDRSLMTVASALGVLKVGAAYVPLDPAYPDVRLQFMLEDTGANVVLTDREGEERLGRMDSNATLIRLDSPSSVENHPDSEIDDGVDGSALAYVVYTSGSTGRPKGVLAPHRGVVRLVMNPNYIRLDENVRFLAYAPFSFDASTLEIWGPLLNGGVVVVAPPGLLTMEELGRFIEEASITTTFITSALFHQLVDSRVESFDGVKELFSGGDVLSPQHVRRVVEGCPECHFIAAYGPTENTTFSSCHPVRSVEDIGATVSIGRPIRAATGWHWDISTALSSRESGFSRTPSIPVGLGDYIGPETLSAGHRTAPSSSSGGSTTR